MEIARLYLGSIAGPLGPATPFNGYLVKHPQGLFLVDTGFGPTLGGEGQVGTLVQRGREYPWVRRTTAEALEDHGVEPGDVAYIVNTHLGDHSGENAQFPKATFVIQTPEVEHVRRTQPDAYRKTWDFPGAKLELLDGEDAEILPGVHCLFTPGHTPGHQSVLVEDGETKTLFVGDAVYTWEVWRHPEEMQETHPAFSLQIKDPALTETWRESAQRLQAIDADVLHFAHDANVVHTRR